MVAVRRSYQHADHATPRRQRPDLLAVAHDRALLADAFHVPHRPQPPPQRLRHDFRIVDGLPRLQLPHPARERDDGEHPARCRVVDVLGRQEPQRADRRVDDGRGPKKNWPLGQGYDRFYGFIGGETNNWYPSLAEDNHYIDQPYLPEDGYHLSKDLADQALRMIRDSKQTEPDKPWYLWFCPGANHAPHHAPEEYIAKYRGVFDDGYEAYRAWVLRAHDREGDPPGGNRAHADQSDGRRDVQPDGRRAPVGRAERRGEGDVLPDGRGVRRILRIHRHAGRPYR